MKKHQIMRGNLLYQLLSSFFFIFIVFFSFFIVLIISFYRVFLISFLLRLLPIMSLIVFSNNFFINS